MIPTLQEELDRKVAETCDLLSLQRDRGDIDDDQYVAALRALNSATRGLIDSDISLWVDDQLRVSSEQSSVVALHRGQQLILLNRAHGDDRFAIHQFKVEEHKVSERVFEEGDMVRESKDGMVRLIDKMKSIGFDDINQKRSVL